MAFLQPYGTGFGYSGYPAATYSFAPTAFAAPQAQEAHEGSQVGDEHASQSASGFAADPNAAYFYGQPTYLGGAPLIYGQNTVLPSTSFVPVAAPRVRRPGYNERLVAWRNRQKAFNRYKRATKEAIKNANRQQAWASYGSYGYGAPTVFGAPYGAPFGATILPGAGFVYDQSNTAAPAQEGAYPTFGDFSQQNAEQHQAQEEPEIRGTQV